MRSWAILHNATLIEYDIGLPSPLLSYFSDIPRSCWPHANKNWMLSEPAQSDFPALPAKLDRGGARVGLKMEALSTLQSLRALLSTLNGSCSDDSGVQAARGLAQNLEEQLGSLSDD